MKLVDQVRSVKTISRATLYCVMFIALTLAAAPSRVLAAELVMFEQAGCVWCAAFDREIAPVYGKTLEGITAPLRRVDIDRPPPEDLAFIQVERLTPLFVLIDKGHEIGRIRGYPGEDHFWGLLGVLIKKLDRPGTGGERTQLLEN
jgi:thioredoxin-related protein